MFGKILIVDDSLLQIKILEKKLVSEYYNVVTANSGEEALEKLETEKPDLIMLDVMMGGINGFETCKKIKSNLKTFHVPVLIITSLIDEESKIQGLEAGADDILTKPIDDIALFARVNSLLRLKMMAEQWIMQETELKDRDIDSNHLDIYFGKKCKYSHVMVYASCDKESYELAKPLKEKGYKVAYTKSDSDAEYFVKERDLDLIIISLSIGIDKALRFSSGLRSVERTKKTPILIIGNEDDEAAFIKALEIGCNDYISRPFDNHEYLARVYIQLKKNKYQQQLEENYQKSLSLASTDELTGLANRRALHTYMKNILVNMKDKSQNVAIMMLDIDHFKGVNDTYGHKVGDEVLVEFSQRIKESLRDFDMVARYGGDEFIAIVPYIDERTALEVAERVRISVAKTPFAITVDPYKLNIQISIGISLDNDFTLDPDEIIEKADKSLYEAKECGKNTVCIYNRVCCCNKKK